MKKAIPFIISILLVLLLIPGCSNNKQQEIINFTKEAYVIELKGEILNLYSGLYLSFRPYSPVAFDYYLNGMKLSDYLKIEPKATEDLDGMYSLKNKMALLDCPQSMQSIKDSLINIYESEIRQYQLSKAQSKSSNSNMLERPLVESSGGSVTTGEFPTTSLGDTSFYPQVNYKNIDDYKNNYSISKSEWYRIQSFHHDVIVKWSQLLKDSNIDAAKEGFTELIIK